MNKKQATAVFGLVIGLLLLALVFEGRARFPLVNRVLLAVVSPINSLMQGVSDRVNNTTGYFTSLAELREKNEKLQQEIDDLRQDNVNYATMKTENEQLRGLLNYKQNQPNLEFVTARIIGRDMGDLHDTFVINRGEDDGVKVDMSVVTNTGLVGIVDAVFPSAARVLLLNSPHTRIGGMDLRGDSRIAGIVSGVTGREGLLTMRNMARNADLLPGDTVVTSGYSGYHPAGLVIGNIEEVTMDGGGLTKVATIVPAVDFAKLEVVMVVTNYQGFANVLDETKQAVKAKKDISRQEGTHEVKKESSEEEKAKEEGSVQ